MAGSNPNAESSTESATFGGGCFWCTEAVFKSLEGVRSVISGYSGGASNNPTYEQVCGGHTGHAEVIQVQFDPNVIPYEDLLEVFWKTHDPTTKNRQGHDVGTQYRSVVFFHNDQQRQIAEAYKKQLNESGLFKSPIVTEISPLVNFFPAEKYHQDYFELNPQQAYCQAIIRPKLDKFSKEFTGKLRSPAGK